MRELGVYIHIPFCLSKCFYCDFLSFDDRKDFAAYTEALIEEIRSFDFSSYNIATVFMGGGTPTVLPPSLLQKIIEALPRINLGAGCNSAAGLNSGVEFTVEANPGTLDAEKLRALKASGVNRLSIGLQAWQDRILKKIGRVHTKEQFIFNYEQARKAGFDNVNVDLMFSLPSQTQEDLSETLKEICALGAEHISLYSLILEDGTKLSREWEADEDADREMYAAAVDFLNEQGYERYEISNFAKPGYACRHNINYWRRGDYIGFGLGAHSFLKGRRFHNTEDYETYLKCYANAEKKDKIIINRQETKEDETVLSRQEAKEDETILNRQEAMEEFMFLGLRMAEGVRARDFEEQFGESIFDVYGEAIKKFCAGDFLCVADGRVWLSDKGIDVFNILLAEFLQD